jgi:hypothetical protein
VLRDEAGFNPFIKKSFLLEGQTKLLPYEKFREKGFLVEIMEFVGSSGIRVPALIDLYIHPLYVLVSKILSFILNSSALIHPLYHPLFTLSTMGSTYHFI